VAIPLGPESVRPRLEGSFGRPLFLYAERCSSTQDLLPTDAPEGAVAVAEEQTGGRGRRGREWEGTAGKSLLFSLCLRPQVEVARFPSLTPVAARAVADAISSLGLQAAVKDPNDVLVSGKKVAGILAEARDKRIALGVGVNVSQTLDELPRRPIFPATSLVLELGREPGRAELLVEILERMERHYLCWLSEAGTQ
jgi:BirA family biotin operon repressor/biotin-[acetyl-CoA-carboxylase] ligase